MRRTRRNGLLTNRPGKNAAFTLIEVLVVVAIIALLVAILLPSLESARRAAKRSVCMAQLKQIHTGLFNYMMQVAPRDHLPDSDTLGGWWFRYLVGERSDPSANPEGFGLPALLDRWHCMPGKTGVWMCPDTPKHRTKYKNSYAWAMFNTKTTDPTTKNRVDNPNSTFGKPYTQLRLRMANRVYKPMLVFDNWRFNAPVPTGARYLKKVSDSGQEQGDVDTSTAADKYLTVPDNEIVYPHAAPNSLLSWGGKNKGDRARNVNTLRFDGSVMRWDPNAGQ